MWKPIYQPEPWPQYLKRRDNVGVPLMEVRKKYMEEQLLFENYISSMKHLNVLSPSLAGVGAASGGGPSVPGGGGVSDLFFEAEYIVGRGVSDQYGDLLSISRMGKPDNATLYNWNDEVTPVSASNLWRYPYTEVGTNHSESWNPASAFSMVTQSVIPTPDLWVNGMPPDVDGRDIFTGLYQYNESGAPSRNYSDFLSGTSSFGPFFKPAQNSQLSLERRTISTGIDWVLENPIKIDWGDGNIDNYSGDQTEPYGVGVGPWVLELVSEVSASWNPNSASVYEYNNIAQRHYYNLEDIMPEAWASVVPEPEFQPRYYPFGGGSNRFVRHALELSMTSSEGNYPWGSPYNNWFDFNQQKTSIKIYGNPNTAGNVFKMHDNNKPVRINYWDTSGYTSYAGLFDSSTDIDITPLNIASWDTSNVTDMSEMFYRSNFVLGEGIPENNLTNWDTSNVTDMSYMFGSRYETDGKNPEVGNWDVSNVTNFSWMFSSYQPTLYESCKLSADLTNWNVRGDANISAMFWQCGALQTPTNFNNWNISGSTNISFMFIHTSFNQALTNWELGDGCDARGIFNKVGLSHTGFWDTLKAWASGSASNVNFHLSTYQNQLGYTPSRTYSKKVDSVSGGQIPITGHIHTPTDSAINYSDFYKWFANHTRNTNITCISGSTNHQAYETLLDRGWTMGAIDIIATGSIASERITQLPINVTVDSGNFVISSSYFTPVSELQPYDNYDPLYTPTLTYRFDQSDSSNTNHPLKLSTTLDGTHGGGTEYTVDVTYNGTPGTSGSYTDVMVSKLNGFEVESKPKLYVYCQNHSGMSNFYLEAYT